jgi:Arc/MetJ family transcription regulator
VKLIAPQLVKPYIKRGKNDAAAYYSRWGGSRQTVEAMRVKLASFRGAR